MANKKMFKRFAMQFEEVRWATNVKRREALERIEMAQKPAAQVSDQELVTALDAFELNGNLVFFLYFLFSFISAIFLVFKFGFVYSF